jgi:tRNA dimethylallyltransferase
MATISQLVVIVGPTASGKTALAIEVARAHNGEIICADSRTVYKGMDIGTAKPTAKEQAEVSHWGIDLVRPNQSFTAAEFQQYARAKIDEIASRGKLPILVGGTGLYVDSVLFNYQFGPSADPVRRVELEAMPLEQLIEYCQKNSIELPANPKNKRHLVRAIELGGINTNRDRKMRDNTIVVGITASKETLEPRIRMRAEQMFEQDIIAETTTLVATYGLNNEAMTGNIYPIVWRMIQGEITKHEARELFIRADTALAKRQRTWFKRNPTIVWSESRSELRHIIEHFLSHKI